MDLKDYYTVLNVDREASGRDIKKAYHKMAMTYHPDVNDDETGCEEKLKEINEAYGILGDENKRLQYDRLVALSNRNELFFKKQFDNEPNIFQGRFYRNTSIKRQYGCKRGVLRKGGCRRKQWK